MTDKTSFKSPMKSHLIVVHAECAILCSSCCTRSVCLPRGRPFHKRERAEATHYKGNHFPSTQDTLPPPTPPHRTVPSPVTQPWSRPRAPQEPCNPAYALPGYTRTHVLQRYTESLLYFNKAY